MSPEAPAPLAPPRRARVRALLLALLVPALSLVVVFTTPTTAHALDVGPKTIQGALKSPPAQIIRWTPAGRAVTLGLGLAMLAYETRDHWWPMAEGILNPTEEEAYNDGSTYLAPSESCTLGSQQHTLSGTAAILATIQGTCSRSYFANYQPAVQWSYTNIRCRTADGFSFYTANSKSWQMATGQNGNQVTNQPTPPVVSSFYYNKISPTLCSSSADALMSVTIRAEATQIKAVPNTNLVGLNGGVADADYESTTTIQCRSVSTEQIVGTVTATTVGRSDRVTVPSCAEEYPGSIPWTGSVTGSAAGATTSVGTFSTDQALYDQWRDCFGPTGVICKTEVYVDGQRCVIGSDVCVIWWRIWRGEPERVECRFGTHVVAIDSCMPLKRAYGTGTKVVTATDVDVLTDPALDPDAPAPSAGPTTGTGAAPTTGPNPSTPAAPEPAAETDPNSSSCYGGAWTWNPIDWVFVPVKCALKWAFVPKTALATRVANIKTGLDTKAPFAWVSGIAAIPAAVPGGACPDWNVKVGNLTKNVVCESSYTDAIRGARPVLLIFMTGLAIWPLVRSTAYAAFPILKPQPGVLR